MTDQQLALQAVSDAQRILEEYLEPRPRNNERMILDKLVEVLERLDLLVRRLIGCSAACRRAVVARLLVGPCEFKPVLSKL